VLRAERVVGGDAAGDALGVAGAKVVHLEHGEGGPGTARCRGRTRERWSSSARSFSELRHGLIRQDVRSRRGGRDPQTADPVLLVGQMAAGAFLYQSVITLVRCTTFC
jgi:hypothetical protein